MCDADAAAVLTIYREGLDSGEASFETEPPDWNGWCARYLAECRLVAEIDGRIAGWAALAPVSARPCYRGVAEVSIYIAGLDRGRGVGDTLLAALVKASEDAGIWTLVASIFPENAATRRLHLRHGFREVGRRERIAQQHGRWRDTLLLERRSMRVGS